MKLTETDKITLGKWGYTEKDILQIEKAIRVSKYHLYRKQGKDMPISSGKALELLGREKFLSGMARSAFHGSAMREDNNMSISFDSTRLFG